MLDATQNHRNDIDIPSSDFLVTVAVSILWIACISNSFFLQECPGLIKVCSVIHPYMGGSMITIAISNLHLQAEGVTVHRVAARLPM